MATPNVNTASIPTPNIASPATPIAQMIAPGESTELQQAIFYPDILTTLGIQNAINAANAAGGGIVQLPAATITLVAPGLTLLPKVVLQGVAGSVNLQSFVINGGTVLQGDGTFIGISANPSDRSAEYGSVALLWQSVLLGIGVRNLILNNFSYGLKVGGKFNGGASDFEFYNVTAYGCTQWGFWFENCILGFQHKITSYNCGVGHIMHRCSTALWNFGNYTLIRTFAQAQPNTGISTIATRGIVFEAAGSGVTMNFTNAFDLQSNGGGLSSTQACTMINTQTNITVTDGTKFAVGMPVTFSTIANGFGTTKTYIVLSVSGNVITVGTDYAPAGSAIAATGNSAINVITNGMASLECIGTNSGALTNCTFESLDLEQSAGLVVAHGVGNRYKTSTIPGGTAYPVVTALACDYSNIFEIAEVPTTVDFASSQHAQRLGTFPANFAPVSAGSPFLIVGTGFGYNIASGNAGFSMSGSSNNATNPFDFYLENGQSILRSNTLIVPGTSGGLNGVQATSATTFSFNRGNGPVCVMSGASGVFQVAENLTTDTQLGYSFLLCNRSAGNQTVQTTTSGGSLNMTGIVPGGTVASSGTSFTLGANMNVRLTSSKTPAGVYEWAIG